MFSDIHKKRFFVKIQIYIFSKEFWSPSGLKTHTFCVPDWTWYCIWLGFVRVLEHPRTKNAWKKKEILILIKKCFLWISENIFMCQRSKGNFLKEFVMVEKNYTNLSTGFLWIPDLVTVWAQIWVLKPKSQIFIEILLNFRDPNENFHFVSVIGRP